MYQELEAVYEHGVLRPIAPINLAESQRVHITITDSPGEASRPPRTGFAKRDMALLARMRAEVAAMDNIPTLEEVRRELSVIPGSMVDDFIAERDDR